MKTKYLIIMLLASFLLTSCENNDNQNMDDNQNISMNEQEPNIVRSQPTERLSYNDYVEKYGEPLIQDIEENEDVNEEDDIDENQTIYYDTTENIPANQLATYSTPLLSSTNERINNIEIVCERLNNFILNPNESFSYNDVAGPYGPSDGFEEATILLSDGTKSESYGGGVCQLSSTLYNVVKNIENVEITERHHHSAPVAYVPEGEDATVSLQSGLDFKFVNNNDYPIRFEATCGNGNVVVRAFREV